ncbi:MAG: tetratricopeptide repeat protein, partial [Bacteroidota bacterium]
MDFDDMFPESGDKNENMEEKLRKYRQALRKHGGNSPEISNIEALEELVNYCLENDRFDDALAFCKVWAEYAPYSSDAWHKLGFIYLNLDNFSKAHKYLDKALILNPMDSEALLNKSIT